jgi:hypothetical protein
MPIQKQRKVNLVTFLAAREEFGYLKAGFALAEPYPITQHALIHR